MTSYILLLYAWCSVVLAYESWASTGLDKSKIAKAIENEDDAGSSLELLQVRSTRTRQSCPVPDAGQFKPAGKGCPIPGQVDGIWGTSCLDQNTGYESLNEAWEKCAVTEDCGLVMQYTDERFYLRRPWDPDISDDIKDVKLYHYQCEGLPPTMSYNMIDRLIIIPEYNLLFCYIEKVACTSFNDVFSQLRMKFDKNAVRTVGPDGWLQNSLYSLGIRKEEVEAMMVNKSWHKALFYRDPIERFVSAYRSKCEGADGDGDYFCKQAFESKYTTFREAVDWMFARRNDPWQNQTVNEHFKRQSSFCGGLTNTLQHYDTVEQLEVHTARDKTINLLSKIGADYHDIEDFDNMFPPAVAPVQGSSFLDSEHTTSAASHVQDYFPAESPDLLAELFIYYQEDYHLFKMSPPEWQVERMAMFMEESLPSPLENGTRGAVGA